MVMGQVSIAVEHNFETAHRLPFLGGKCSSIHGHSWKAKFYLQAYQLEGGMDENGISADFGSVKKVIRQWIDMYLDHGMMIGGDDSLLDDLWNDNSKVFIFGPHDGYQDEVDISYAHRPWPTVEAVAEMLCVKIQEQFGSDLWVIGVEVIETATNSATFTQAVPHSKDVETDG